MEDDQAMTAIANLITAIGSSIMIDDASGVKTRTFLRMLDMFNVTELTPGPGLDKLKSATASISAILDQLGK